MDAGPVGLTDAPRSLVRPPVGLTDPPGSLVDAPVRPTRTPLGRVGARQTRPYSLSTIRSAARASTTSPDGLVPAATALAKSAHSSAHDRSAGAYS